MSAHSPASSVQGAHAPLAAAPAPAPLTPAQASAYRKNLLIGTLFMAIIAGGFIALAVMAGCWGHPHPIWINITVTVIFSLVAAVPAIILARTLKTCHSINEKTLESDLVSKNWIARARIYTIPAK